MHLLLDHDGYLPVFAHITDGSVHEVNIARGFYFPKGSFVAIDRGYVDYKLFGVWTQEGIYFVTRMKSNADYEVVEERAIPKHRNILKDQIIELKGIGSYKKCPYLMRKIEVWDEANNQVIVLLTNHHEFGATTIAAIYKDRWQIEIFFKMIKQPQCGYDTDLDSIIEKYINTMGNLIFKTRFYLSHILIYYLQLLLFYFILDSSDTE